MKIQQNIYFYFVAAFIISYSFQKQKLLNVKMHFYMHYQKLAFLNLEVHIQWWNISKSSTFLFW